MTRKIVSASIPVKMVDRKRKLADSEGRTGKFLAKERKAAKISATAAADYLGVTLTELAQYEGGEKSIPLHRIYAYSNFLNIEPDQIVALLEFESPAKLKRVR